MADFITNSNSDKNNSDSNNGNILKELSDIKSNLAVNSSETINIKNSITEIKTDIREIKNNGVTQEQHKDLVGAIKDQEARIFSLENSKTTITVMLGIGSAIMAVLVGLLTYHIMH